MRWYNPWLESFEWREVPDTDEEALSLLDGYAGAEAHAARSPRGGLRGVASAGGRHNGRAHQGRRSSRGRGQRVGAAAVAPSVAPSLTP